MLRLMDIQPMYGHVYMVTLDRNGKTLCYEFVYRPPSKPGNLPHLDHPLRLDGDLYDYAEPPLPQGKSCGALIIPALHVLTGLVAKMIVGESLYFPIVLDERYFPERTRALTADPPESPGAVAGLSWPMLDPVVDSDVPAQPDSAACGPACIHMVLRDRDIDVPQSELVIRARARVHPKLPSRFVHHDTLLGLVRAVDPDGRWIGGELPASCLRDMTRQQLLELLGECGPWIAQVGRHFVVVDRVDSQTGELFIRDPWYQPGWDRGVNAGTRYRVATATFFDSWRTVAIYRDVPC